jgi:WD40 repeat protein
LRVVSRIERNFGGESLVSDQKTPLIFVSSPGDVSEERALAESVLRRLGEEYRGAIRLEVVLWEHEPVFAHTGYQQQIVRPSQCDLVICILWSRLGTRLPVGFASEAGRAPTGTEFEVSDALEGRRRGGKPNLLIYRKTAAPQLSLASAEARERLRQYELLDEFCRRTFYDEQGAVVVAHTTYQESYEFERKLIEHVRKWLATQVGESFARPRWTSGSPYRGLEAFEAEHREIYFGRGQALSELIGRLRDSESRQGSVGRITRFLLVQGMSGNGKSSLIRAGLLPLLEGRAIEGIGVWRQVILKPSARSEKQPGAGFVGALVTELIRLIPAIAQSYPDSAQLAERVRKAPGESAARLDGYLTQEAIRIGLEPARIRLVVFIDQFEEIFEQSVEEDERRGFIEILEALASEGRIWVIATMRSDFAGRIEEYPRLVDLTREGHLYLLGPPQPDELAEMIREPARAAGLEWENRAGVTLDQSILRDATANPESLPLLEYALDLLYERQGDRRLTYAGYEAIGGLKGGIAQSAEEVLTKHPEIASSFPLLMRSLVIVDENGTAVRRYAPLAEFAAGTSERALLDALIARRLCVTDLRGNEAVASFAHEALIQSWPRVSDWLKEEAGLLQTRELALREARLWQQHSESDEWLATADKLIAFQALEDAHIGLPEHGSRFIELSRRRVRRVVRLKRLAVSAIALLAVLATGAGWIASRKEREAEQQTAQALDAQVQLLTEAAAERLKDGDFAYARGIILEVLRQRSSLGPPDPAALNVFQEVRASDPGLAILTGHEGPVRRAAYSPDGSRIVTASFDGTARIWDSRTGIQLSALSGEGMYSVAYSPDGTRIVTASSDRTARIWDAHSGREILLLKDGERVTDAAFSPDGSQVATVSEEHLRLWDSHTGTRIGLFSVAGAGFVPLHRDAGYRGSIAYSPDGKRIVTSMDDRTARVLDARTGAVLLVLSGHTDDLAMVAYSSDGRRIVTAGDNSARVWDATTGHQLLVLSGHSGEVWSARFSPDGTTIATASVDKTARIWDAMTGTQLKVLSGHTNILCAAAYSPDGSQLVTSAWDGTARTWNLHTGVKSQILIGHTDAVSQVTYSPDGEHLLTVSGDKTARIWDAQTGTQINVLHSQNELNSAAYSPDGAQILTTSTDKSARIWDARTLTPIKAMTGPAAVLSASYSPDGEHIVASFENSTFGVWDARTGELGDVRSGHRDSIGTAVFSPDGMRILTASVDKTARLWDAKTLAPLTVMSHDDFVNMASFSPDGTRIVTALNDSTARIWDARTGQQVGVLSGHRSWVPAVDYSPDGNRIVTGSKDQTVRIWDAHSGAELAVLTGHTDIVNSVGFAPDGAHVASASADKTVRIWDAHIPADVPAQLFWAWAVESDPLADVQRTQLGLTPTAALLADSTLKSYSTGARRARYPAADATACDRQAGAFYDPDRREQGILQDRIDPDMATSACAPLVSSQKDSARALYQQGRALVAKSDFAGARRDFEEAISKGYKAARVDLALLLTNPEAKIVDTGRAVALYQQAWEQGLPFAGFKLAELYEHGVSGADATVILPADPTQAWFWYRKAAAAGNPNAIARIADRDERAALTAAGGERDAHFLQAFALYAQAAKSASDQYWPDGAWRAWRYRRSSLARVLAEDSMMSEVATAYKRVLDGRQLLDPSALGDSNPPDRHAR